MSRTTQQAAETADVAASIVRDVDAWLELRDLILKQLSVMSALARETQVMCGLPPFRGLLAVEETAAPMREAELHAQVAREIANALDQFVQERIRKSRAYEWLSGRAPFQEIEGRMSNLSSKPVSSSQGLSSRNTINFFGVLLPSVIQWAVLRDGRTRHLVRRVSLPKKDMRDAATKADELANLIGDVIKTGSDAADRFYSYIDWDSVTIDPVGINKILKPNSLTLYQILRTASEEWRSRANLTERTVRDDETTLDRRFLGELSLGFFNTFQVDCSKHVEGLARVFSINLHRSRLGKAAKVSGKGSV